MGRLVLLISLSLLAFACTHKPTPPTRAPASFGSTIEKNFFGNGNGMEDEYGDTKVIFCKPGQWIVTHDPNRCGRATKLNQACTEMPTFHSGPLKPEMRGSSLMLTNLRDRFEVKTIGANKYQIKVGRSVETLVREATIDPNYLKFVCQ